MLLGYEQCSLHDNSNINLLESVINFISVDCLHELGDNPNAIVAQFL